VPDRVGRNRTPVQCFPGQAHKDDRDDTRRRPVMYWRVAVVAHAAEEACVRISNWNTQKDTITLPNAFWRLACFRTVAKALEKLVLRKGKKSHTHSHTYYIYIYIYIYIYTAAR
jgi:hypothetical protein